MPKFTKGHYSCPEAIDPSKFLLINTNLLIKLWGSSSNSIWDILLAKEKCPNLQRAITLEIFFRIYSKVNQVIITNWFIKFQGSSKSFWDTRVLQKVLSLGSDYFSATFYQTYFYYKPLKYSPFTETHFCNLFTQSRKADKLSSFGICWRHW